jgi:hypothetical protein
LAARSASIRAASKGGASITASPSRIPADALISRASRSSISVVVVAMNIGSPIVLILECPADGMGAS